MKKRKNKKRIFDRWYCSRSGCDSRRGRNSGMETVDKYGNTAGNGEKLFCACRKKDNMIRCMPC